MLDLIIRYAAQATMGIIIREERVWLDGEEHLVFEAPERPGEGHPMPLTLANGLRRWGNQRRR